MNNDFKEDLIKQCKLNVEWWEIHGQDYEKHYGKVPEHIILSQFTLGGFANSAYIEPIKVLLNNCWGAFGISTKAREEYFIKTGIKLSSADFPDLTHGMRTDHVLIEIVEKLGDLANAENSELVIVEIPNDIEWDIMGCDGMEHVTEKHRTWN